jgi:hypothetical protein
MNFQSHELEKICDKGLKWIKSITQSVTAMMERIFKALVPKDLDITQHMWGIQKTKDLSGCYY